MLMKPRMDESARGWSAARAVISGAGAAGGVARAARGAAARRVRDRARAIVAVRVQASSPWKCDCAGTRGERWNGGNGEAREKGARVGDRLHIHVWDGLVLPGFGGGYGV